MQPSAQPKRFPGQRRQRGTNWGLCNDVGNCCTLGPNIAAFATAKAAREWLEDAAAPDGRLALTFRYVHVDALASSELKEIGMQGQSIRERQRPFWRSVGSAPVAGAWPISDMGEWLRVTKELPGIAFQVLWREVKHCQYRHRNFLTPKEAASFARALLDDQRIKLLDVGISAEQPLQDTELVPGRVRDLAARLGQQRQAISENDSSREQQRREEEDHEPRLPGSYFRGDDIVDF